MKRRNFFGVFGTLLFGPEIVGREPSVLYGGVKSDYDYHAQYGLMPGKGSVMLPERGDYEAGVMWIEYDDGSLVRVGKEHRGQS